jgi:predicted permease
MMTEALLQDIRYTWRLLRRAPAFTAVAVLTLALGIGANTAIFSIVNGVILRPLKYPAAERLMYLTTRFGVPGPKAREFWISPPEYLEFREINRSFSAVGAYTTGEVNLTAGDRPIRARSALVDEHLLEALGVQPAQGRLFARGETDVIGPPQLPGQPPPLPPSVAILSHELWQSAFGGRPIVGRTVDVDGRAREVVGIMPPATDLMDNRTEIWLPLGLNPGNRQNRGNHFLYAIGRLRNDVSISAAQDEVNALMRNWASRAGVTPGPGAAGHFLEQPWHVLVMRPLQQQMLGSAGRSIWVLQAAVGFVLLIACANLASLLLARAESRHRELAVRTALGAARGRLLRQFITEGVLLSAAGGTLGVFLASAAVRALIRAYPTVLPRASEVTVDPIALLFTLVVATAAGLIFGLAPLMHTRVGGLVTALKEGGATGAVGSARHRVRRGLVMTEVALAVMLVIGAGLLVRTVYNLATVDAGFDRSRLVTFSITLPAANYPRPSARAQLFQRLLDNLRAVAGVQAATAMSGLPPNRPLNANDTDIDNYTAPQGGPYENVDFYQNVMSDYFETMGIPIVEGRGFQRTDAGQSGLAAVVNETLVKTFWKGQSPIGQRLRICCGQNPWFTVVGVAKDVKQGGVDQKTGTEFYFSVDQTASVQPGPGLNLGGFGTMNVVLRTTLPLATLAPSIERIVRDADRTVPIVRLRDMEGVFADSIGRPRLLAQLIGAFAGLALLLAAIGTYGVLSHIVAERRREIGIRLALGAERAGVLAEVMRQGLVLTAIGIAAGLAGALGVNRLLASLLFGVAPTDTITIAAVVGTMTLIACAACWTPAWRASRVDPIVVLRDE